METIDEQNPCVYCGAVDAETHAFTCQNKGQGEQPSLNPISEDTNGE